MSTGPGSADEDEGGPGYGGGMDATTDHVSPDAAGAAPPAHRGGGSWAPALSASRAKEFLRCPLQYRLHVVDGIRDPATPATAMGTLIHSVLEHLFDVPAPERTPERAESMVDPAFERQARRDPTVLGLFEDDARRDDWMGQVRQILRQYFQVEDPRWLEPAGRERRVDVVIAGGIRLRGFIDRIDRSPAGDLRVVDYKTGRAPQPRFVDEALYQMRFYALLLRDSARLPARTQLLYLRSGQVLTLDPDPADIDRFAQEVARLWEQIEAAARGGRFEPRKNPLCNWCHVQSMCPLFGGTTPDLPEDRVEWLLGTRVESVA